MFAMIHMHIYVSNYCTSEDRAACLYNLDMHEANFMLRDKALVILDPYVD